MKIKAKGVTMKESEKGCALITCIDPKTGQLRIVKASKGCPKGYIRRVNKAIMERGILMAKPEDEEDEG